MSNPLTRSPEWAEQTASREIADFVGEVGGELAERLIRAALRLRDDEPLPGTVGDRDANALVDMGHRVDILRRWYGYDVDARFVADRAAHLRVLQIRDNREDRLEFLDMLDDDGLRWVMRDQFEPMEDRAFSDDDRIVRLHGFPQWNYRTALLLVARLDHGDVPASAGWLAIDPNPRED